MSVQLSMGKRILQALEQHGPMTLGELQTAVGAKSGREVKGACLRLKGVSKHDGHYVLEGITDAF